LLLRGLLFSSHRKQYKRFSDGKQSSITNERIRMLQSIGFSWNAQSAAWESHWSDLKAFREESGHCHAPLNHPLYPKLGLWVKEQRRHFTLLKQGKASHMTPFRIEKLNELDFCWDTHEATWQERLAELKLFREAYGHCQVPTHWDENPKL
jgi:Helicase associated domain